jgi:hypothetical protein
MCAERQQVNSGFPQSRKYSPTDCLLLTAQMIFEEMSRSNGFERTVDTDARMAVTFEVDDASTCLVSLPKRKMTLLTSGALDLPMFNFARCAPSIFTHNIHWPVG